jgi:hypothetical protein
MKYTLKEWQSTLKDTSDIIVQASSMNMDDAWQPFPIGMSWQYVKVHTERSSLQLGSHENLLLCSFRTNTDEHRRKDGINRRHIESILRNIGIYNRSLDYKEYFLTLPNYKFIISPEGNGIDCHRHYEALMAGCIPIIEHNELVEEKYKGCPILYTHDYSEITPDFLEKKYNEMLNEEYDFTKLFLSGYTYDMQNLIKKSGNFWLNEITETRCSWYT